MHPLNKADVSREYTQERKENETKKVAEKANVCVVLRKEEEQIFPSLLKKCLFGEELNSRHVRSSLSRSPAGEGGASIVCVLALQYSLLESGLLAYSTKIWSQVATTPLIVWPRLPLSSGSCAGLGK